MSGKQIKLFLVDGTPGGLTTAEITNWTGHVLSARRPDLADLLKRDEAQRTGVYLLLGDDEAAIGDTRCSIVVENGHGRLARDIVFSSPSTAGTVALGRSCNGRREWIAGSETFGAWESRGVE